ncbi:MAG: 50S ribosomal protein L17 [Deltaproteobacteria bacterium]
MRHLKAGKRLGRTSAHRLALYRNLVTELVKRGRIETTDAKAKELRGIADRMVTLGKKGTLAARRRAAAYLRSPQAVQHLFAEVGPSFQDRPGGYTRVTKLGLRTGDAAPMSVIEFTGRNEAAEPKKKPRRKVAAEAEAEA